MISPCICKQPGTKWYLSKELPGPKLPDLQEKHQEIEEEWKDQALHKRLIDCNQIERGLSESHLKLPLSSTEFERKATDYLAVFEGTLKIQVAIFLFNICRWEKDMFRKAACCHSELLGTYLPSVDLTAEKPP